ncbi:conserved hypothetical protein [Ricinus communis]|uniref:Uncharacterized protein n=1 Tax=Ricinus communis TaxID=3988 RepID=B9SF76_RICCO|nr:conserved hypothetical protein [Ricinus communis]
MANSSSLFSFNSYSSNHQLADIAAKVTKEERQGNEFLEEASIFTVPRHPNGGVEESSSSDEDENDDDFEFVLVRANPDGNETAFPIFPLFNRDLLLDYENNKEEHHDHGDMIRLPLKKLFNDDRDPPSSSSSSSEADELEGVSPGTYCVWTPSKFSSSPSPSPSRCKKSNSTGSSSKQQRWRLRDLLHLKRSSSDGKESFIFLNTDHNNNNNNNNKKLEEKIEKSKSIKGKGKDKIASAHEVFYVRSKALKEGDKRRSYLPYRQGLVGFFANVNGFGRSVPPF